MTHQVFSDTSPTARTQHFCDDCQRTIEPGEAYRRVAAVGDDGFYTYKSCAHCRALLDFVLTEDPGLRYSCDGIDLGEWLGEYGGPPLRAAFGRRWAGVAPSDLPGLFEAAA